MRRTARALMAVAAGVAAAFAAPAGVRSQSSSQPLPTEITAIRFRSGQSVVPYFEGWIRNSDGTFDMVFGYFNRNHEQEFVIPSGSDNSVEPGGPDQGQPTFFHPRRQRYVFRVRVPANFGKQEVVWTITANGRTERGYGNLLPEQEITERVVMTNGNFNPGHGDPNRPPALTIHSLGSVTAGTAVTLTAEVSDDGLPKPRAEPPPPPRAPQAGGFTAQVNSSGARGPRGLTVTWLQYAGPAKVIFDRTGAIDVAEGRAVTNARFTVPGTYKLVATASDPGRLSTRAELVLRVAGERPSSGQP